LITCTVFFTVPFLIVVADLMPNRGTPPPSPAPDITPPREVVIEPPEEVEVEEEEIPEPDEEMLPPDLKDLDGIDVTSRGGVPGPAFRFPTFRVTDAIWEGSDVFTRPEAIQSVNPRVSARSRGVVLTEFVVETDGRVTAIRILKTPNAEMSSAVRVALQRWRFAPGRDEAGEVVRVRVRMPFEF
jgi:TonB family protein